MTLVSRVGFTLVVLVSGCEILNVAPALAQGASAGAEAVSGSVSAGQIEWAKLSWTMIAALGSGFVALATAVWTAFTWSYQRWQDRRIERQRMAALYVHPFLFATEELQSRLYNILKLSGLRPLMDAAAPHPFAEETAYLIAQYFGWERAILRYGPYTSDANVIKQTRAIRNAFATDKFGTELRIFHPEQGAIAQAMTRRVPGQFGQELEVVSFPEFRRALRPSPDAPRRSAWFQSSAPAAEPSPLSELGSLRRAISTLAATSDPDSPPGAERLARVQAHLVALLQYLEDQEGLALFDGKRLVATEIHQSEGARRE